MKRKEISEMHIRTARAIQIDAALLKLEGALRMMPDEVSVQFLGQGLNLSFGLRTPEGSPVRDLFIGTVQTEIAELTRELEAL